VNDTHTRARPRSGPAREEQVRTIFSEIAPRYDLLNHLLSLNVDRAWRRRAVDELAWEGNPGGLYLDLCAGTGDLAVELAGRRGFRGRVVTADFARPMLVEGEEKGEAAPAPIHPVCGDALSLPFGEGVFHGAAVSFGVRNLASLEEGFRELYRVVRPGGRVVILEFTLPPNPLVRRAYLFYFDRILPLVGRVVSGHPWAYRYLPESVREFPSPRGVAERMERVGFRGVRWSLLTLGIAAIHVGRRI